MDNLHTKDVTGSEHKGPDGAGTNEHTLTTRQGHPVYDNQNQRTVGDRGPATLENYQFLEKIAHFDRERDPRARRARARLRRARLLRGLRHDRRRAGRRRTRAPSCSRRRASSTPVVVRFSTVIGGRDSSEAARDPARLRGQVLDRGRQLGPRRQQPAGLLHPRRDQVPRRHPLAQARPGHLPPGAEPDLRLHEPDAGVDAHAHLALQPARHPGRLPAHGRLRRQHLQVGQRRRRGGARQVPLEAASRAIKSLTAGAGRRDPGDRARATPPRISTRRSSAATTPSGS